MTVLVGLVAGTLTTIAFLPQALRIWKRRSAGDISYTFLLCFMLGVALWFCYGLALRSLPLILANGITLALNASILALKIVNHEGQAPRV